MQMHDIYTFCIFRDENIVLYTYIYTFTYTYIYTHIHTYIYIYALNAMLCCVGFNGGNFR